MSRNKVFFLCLLSIGASGIFGMVLHEAGSRGFFEDWSPIVQPDGEYEIIGSVFGNVVVRDNERLLFCDSELCEPTRWRAVQNLAYLACEDVPWAFASWAEPPEDIESCRAGTYTFPEGVQTFVVAQTSHRELWLWSHSDVSFLGAWEKVIAFGLLAVPTAVVIFLIWYVNALTRELLQERRDRQASL